MDFSEFAPALEESSRRLATRYRVEDEKGRVTFNAVDAYANALKFSRPIAHDGVAAVISNLERGMVDPNQAFEDLSYIEALTD